MVVVKPRFSPEAREVGRLSAVPVDEPALKIARLSVSVAEGHLSRMDFHYPVAIREGVEHLTERHELGPCTHEEYLTAFNDAELDVTHDGEGLIGRGLDVGVRRETVVQPGSGTRDQGQRLRLPGWFHLARVALPPRSSTNRRTRRSERPAATTGSRPSMTSAPPASASSRATLLTS